MCLDILLWQGRNETKKLPIERVQKTFRNGSDGQRSAHQNTINNEDKDTCETDGTATHQREAPGQLVICVFFFFRLCLLHCCAFGVVKNRLGDLDEWQR